MIGCTVAVAVALFPFAPQRVLIGPFQLGDLIMAAGTADDLAQDLKTAGINVKDAQDKMNGWKVYLLDYKVRRPDGRWTWHRPDQGGWGPRALVEGRLSIELKDRKGETVEVAVAECKPFGCHTDLRRIDAGIPPSVELSVVVKLKFRGLSLPGPVEGTTEHPGGTSLILRGFRYDVIGRWQVRTR